MCAKEESLRRGYLAVYRSRGENVVPYPHRHEPPNEVVELLVVAALVCSMIPVACEVRKSCTASADAVCKSWSAKGSSCIISPQTGWVRGSWSDGLAACSLRWTAALAAETSTWVLHLSEMTFSFCEEREGALCWDLAVASLASAVNIILSPKCWLLGRYHDHHLLRAVRGPTRKAGWTPTTKASGGFPALCCQRQPLAVCCCCAANGSCRTRMFVRWDPLHNCSSLRKELFVSPLTTGSRLHIRGTSVNSTIMTDFASADERRRRLRGSECPRASWPCAITVQKKQKPHGIKLHTWKRLACPTSAFVMCRSRSDTPGGTSKLAFVIHGALSVRSTARRVDLPTEASLPLSVPSYRTATDPSTLAGLSPLMLHPRCPTHMSIAIGALRLDRCIETAS